MTPVDAANSTHAVVNQQDAYDSASKVIDAIRNAASRTGVDFSYMVKKASQESGLDSTAQSGNSSAAGLFQFTSQTWLQMVKNHGADYGLENYAAQISADGTGRLHVADPVARHAILALRSDPQISAEMAGELDKQNAAILKQNVGGKIGGTELYLAHFLGAGGASDFLDTLRHDPNATAADILPQAAAANQSIFYDKEGQPKTVGEIYQHFAQKFNGRGDTQIASAASGRASRYTTHGMSVVASAAPAPAAAPPAALVSLPTAIANFSPAASPAPKSLAAANNGAATSAAMDTTRAALASASTLFNTMILGQLQNIGQGMRSPLGALNDFDHSRKTAAYAAIG